MSTPRRLLLFVEGQGDRDAAPILVKRLITDLSGWDALIMDRPPWRVGGVPDVMKSNGVEWIRHLSAARKQVNLGAVLLLLDGDLKNLGKERFCPATFAARLAEWSRQAGGGIAFSVACTFARREYESWFVACADSMAGQPLPDGREGIAAGTSAPGAADDIEETHVRDAKKWLDRCMKFGYKERRDQPLLTELMISHLDAVRSRPMTSFLRLERAVRELVEANRTGQHIVSPLWPKPESPPTLLAPADLTEPGDSTSNATT